MNFPDYLRSIWTDPRFQALDTPVRALLYGALSQVDICGWWAPNPRLVAAEIPGIDLKAAQEQLRPWVQVHPTGWWSFRGYVALQVGEGGLKPTNGFHKGIARVLGVHLKREVAAGALPETIEGLEASSRGALEGSNQAGLPGNGGAPVGQARATGGAVSPESKVQCPESPSLQVESPTRGSGGEHSPTPAPEASRFDDVVNLFEQFAGSSHGQPVDVKPWERDKLHKAAARYGWNLVYKACTAYFVDGRHGGAPSLGGCVDGLPRLISLACTHPDDKRNWWTMPVETQYPQGLQRKHWRCEICGKHAAHGDEFLPADHEHRYTRGEGTGLIVDHEGKIVSVPAWEACVGPNGCGHRRALQGEGVGA